MSTVDRDAVNTFLETVISKLVPRIEAGSSRLKRYEKLLNKFETECKAWRNEHINHVRGITEVVNELCFADHILNDKTVRDAEYEPSIGNTNKTIDFLIIPADSEVPDARIFYDVKTIHPKERDRWDQYEMSKAKGRFTPGTELVLDSKWMGGEIFHNFFAARGKFLEYTLECEEKIRHIVNSQDCRFGMVFCGDGFQWHRDQLEDFADFYFSGRHRPDDDFGTMEAHYLEYKKITLDHTINAFCILERKKPQIDIKLYRNVRGPKFPSL